VVRSAPVEVGRDDVERAFASLLGQSMQRPPAYSAVKVRGRKLVDAARRGEVIEAPARPISVEEVSLVRFAGTDADFVVRCSGGTYVRVLVADVGAALGCGAHLIRLRRTRIGPYRVEDAAAPDAARTPAPVEAAVAHLPRVDLRDGRRRLAAAFWRRRIAGPYAAFDPQGRLVRSRDDGAKSRPESSCPPDRYPLDAARRRRARTGTPRPGSPRRERARERSADDVERRVAPR
jgi:tRNA pseudouridine55 synthase